MSKNIITVVNKLFFPISHRSESIKQLGLFTYRMQNIATNWSEISLCRLSAVDTFLEKYLCRYRYQ